MKFVDFFAGIGGVRLGLERAGHECIGFCEFDKFARQAYKAMYDTSKEWEAHDIRTVNSSDVPKADLWTFGFPCFVAGTLVKTAKGMVPIEDVAKGEMVYTHSLRYQPVVQTMCRQAHKTYHIKAYGTEGIETTEEHPFYVREKSFYYHKGIKKRMFGDAKWVKTIDLHKGYYLGIPIEAKEKRLGWQGITYTRKGKEYFLNNLPLDKQEFYWFIGRWLGDGWTTSTTRNDCDSPRTKVVLCCAKCEFEEVNNKLQGILNYTVSEEDTVVKLIFSNKELFEFLRRYGHGAENKFVHQEILELPTDLLEQVLDGYFSADGCKVKGKIKATTVSRKLAYGLAACVNKVYKKGCAIYKSKRSKTHTIQGREVNQKDTYQIVFSKNKNKTDKAFYDEGFIWCPIWDITEETKETLVYNIGVQDDESYTANAICCHNCQDLSVAGLRKGLQEGERSGLFYEIIRLLSGLRKEDRPRWLLAENVKGLFSAGRGFDFLRCVLELGRLGYNIEYQLLNSKNFGVPQNRERVFVVGCLGDRGGRKVFPVNCTDAEDSYPSEEIRPVSLFNIYGRGKGTGFAGNVYDKDAISPTLNTMGGGNRQPMILDDQGRINKELTPQEICPTLRAQTHGNEPKVIDAIYNNREPRVTDIAPTLRAGRQGLCVGGDIKLVGNIYPSGGQNGNIYDVTGISPALTSGTTDTKGNGGIGSNNAPKIITLGNYMPSGSQSGRIVSTDGIAPTVMENHGSVTCIAVDLTENNPKLTDTVRCLKARYTAGITNFSADNSGIVVKPVLTPDREEKRQNGRRMKEDGEPMFTLTAQDRHGIAIENTIQRVDVPQLVKVRKYPVDTERLVQVLRERKQASGLTNRELAEALEVLPTTVEHWFRTDQCFAIPEPAIWPSLKHILGMDDINEFDESIMTFEEREGVFEKSERCYLPGGIAPTLTAASASEKIVEPSLRIRKLTPKECWRLQGFPDEYFDRAVAAGVSNSQLYKQAGNAVTVNVAEAIGKKLRLIELEGENDNE